MVTNEAIMTHESCLGQGARWSLYDTSREHELVAAAQAGVRDAMDELLVRHKAALYRAARGFTKNREDAEDLVQEAMLRAFVNVHKFRKECHFSTWLIAIVNNAALSLKRKGKNVYFASLDSSHEEGAGNRQWDFPDVRLNPEQEVIQHQLRTLLHTVLRRQSRKHQIVLEKCVFDELRIAEAASSLGLTIGSAKSSLFQARRRVSESFERRGLIKRRNRQTKRVIEHPKKVEL